MSFTISPQDGLLRVSFYWNDRTNSFDTLKRKYREIRDILIRTYGKEGLGLSEPGMWIFDRAFQLTVAEDPSRELWTKSDFDTDNKRRLEYLRLMLRKEIKYLELEYGFQGYWKYTKAKFEAEKAKREAKKDKEAEASPF